jgi:hypothetical protein
MGHLPFLAGLGNAHDPPDTGFTDAELHSLFKLAIDDERVPQPDDFDLESDASRQDLGESTRLL